MSVLESLPIAAFVFAMVFMVLAVLCALLKLFSIGIQRIESRRKAPGASVQPEALPSAKADEPEFSSGELKLHNVDERTAAMIMAIVSDESGIPLSELCFKSIKAI